MTFLILWLSQTHLCFDSLTKTLWDLRYLKLTIPWLLKTGHFGGCWDWDQARLSKSCWEWDFFESLADPWSQTLCNILKISTNLIMREIAYSQIEQISWKSCEHVVTGETTYIIFRVAWYISYPDVWSGNVYSDHHCMDISFLHVRLVGVEWDYSFQLPGSRIPCMGTSSLHVFLSGVEREDPLKLPVSHISCIATSFLNV